MSVRHALFSAHQGERILRPGDADVKQAAFLRHFLRIVKRAGMRQDAVIQPDDEYPVEFQPLDRVQRHQGRAVRVFRDGVLIGDQRQVLEKFGDAALFIIVSHFPQFFHVVPAVILTVVVGFQPVFVTGLTDDAVHQVHDGGIAAHLLTPAHQLRAKICQRKGTASHFRPVDGFRSQPSEVQQHRAGGFLRLISCQVQVLLCFLPNPAGRYVDHAGEADLVGWIEHQPQIGDHVLDFAPPVKSLGAHQTVGHSAIEEGIFKQTGLCIGSIKDREIPALRVAIVDQLLDGVRHKAGFVPVILGLIQADELTGTTVGEELLGCAVLIAVDHAARSVQDVLNGAVVLFQQDLLALGIILLELQNIAVIRAAPAVNGLVFIADGE